MLKEKLIKSYLYLHDKESTGWKGWVLQYIKNNIKNILEWQLKKDDVQSVDLLTRSQSTWIENILGEINNISIVDFLQYNQPSKIQVVDKIIKLCTQLGDKIDISILDLSQDIKQTLQQNITDEQVLVSYISQVKDICETLLKTDTATYKKLRMIANKAELFEVLTQTSTELEKDEEVFYTTQRIDEVKKETFWLVYKNCDFIKEADRKVEQSIIIFTYAIKIKNYNRAKNILKKRGDDMQIYRLYRFYELMKEYISFLEKSDDENNKNEVESVIYTMIQDLETHKVDYLQSAYTRIGNQKLHRESIAQFDTLNTILKKLTAFNHMHEFRSTPKDAAVYLAKVDRWPRQVMKYLMISVIQWKISMRMQKSYLMILINTIQEILFMKKNLQRQKKIDLIRSKKETI